MAGPAGVSRIGQVRTRVLRSDARRPSGPHGEARGLCHVAALATALRPFEGAASASAFSEAAQEVTSWAPT